MDDIHPREQPGTLRYVAVDGCILQLIDRARPAYVSDRGTRHKFDPPDADWLQANGRYGVVKTYSDSIISDVEAFDELDVAEGAFRVSERALRAIKGLDE